MFSGSLAYISDTCPPEERALRMTVLDVIIMLTKGVSSLGSGYWIKAQGLIWPFVFVIAGKFLTLLYALFFMPETVDTSIVSADSGNALSPCLESLWLYVKDRPRCDGLGRRTSILLVVLSYVVLDVISPYDVLTLFLMNTPFCMNSVALGYFTLVACLMRCVAMLVAGPLLRRCMPEPWIAIIGRMSYIAEYILLAFATTKVMAIIGEYRHNSTGEIGRIGRHRAETHRHFNIRVFGQMPPDASDFFRWNPSFR